MTNSVLEDLTLAKTQSKRQKFFSLLNDIFYIGAKLRESNSYKRKVNTISQVLCLFAAPAFGKTKGLWFSKGHKDDARKTSVEIGGFVSMSFHCLIFTEIVPRFLSTIKDGALCGLFVRRRRRSNNAREENIARVTANR